MTRNFGLSDFNQTLLVERRPSSSLCDLPDSALGWASWLSYHMARVSAPESDGVYEGIWTTTVEHCKYIISGRGHRNTQKICRSCKRGSSRRTKSKWILLVGKCWDSKSEERWLAALLTSCNFSNSERDSEAKRHFVKNLSIAKITWVSATQFVF